MKNIYITLSFALLASITAVNAQTKDTKKADQLFKSFEYVKAAEQYLKLTSPTAKADPYVAKQLAESYYNMFNTAEAIKWYAKAIESPQSAETHYKYAQMLKASGNAEEANVQMKNFASKAPADARAIAFLANPNYLAKLNTLDKNFDVKKLEINSDQSDFGAVLNNNTLYFASARNQSRKTYGWIAEPFLDIYTASRNTDGTFAAATTLPTLNTKYHDGPVTLSKDGNTMYFASESYNQNSFEKDKATKNKMGQVSLYKATKAGNVWGNATPLPFNSKTYSTSNPSLSPDGKTLYFSSNMFGTLGGIDLWKTSINADGSYGTPENLGARVNTEGNESFPFIAEDNNTLYFASSGRQGFGGLDVFEINLVQNNSQATNLGKPVNTEKDDFAFTFDKEKKVGFLSSNREKSDDLYQVNPVCRMNVFATVTNAETGAILPNAKVSLLDNANTIIGTETSNDKGEVNFKTQCDTDYTLSAEKTGYNTNTFAVAKSSVSTTTKIEAKLVPTPVIITEKEIILLPIYFEYNKSNITQDGAFELDKLVAVLNENKSLVIFAKSHTDNRGSDAYNNSLSDRRAKATVQYVISKGIAQSRISGKGMGKTEPKIDCGATCTEEQHASNRRSEFLIVK